MGGWVAEGAGGVVEEVCEAGVVEPAEGQGPDHVT